MPIKLKEAVEITRLIIREAMVTGIGKYEKDVAMSFINEAVNAINERENKDAN